MLHLCLTLKHGYIDLSVDSEALGSDLADVHTDLQLQSMQVTNSDCSRIRIKNSLHQSKLKRYNISIAILSCKMFSEKGSSLR